MRIVIHAPETLSGAVHLRRWDMRQNAIALELTKREILRSLVGEISGVFFYIYNLPTSAHYDYFGPRSPTAGL
jgi:uncharacterized membrane protein YpjA